MVIEMIVLYLKATTIHDKDWLIPKTVSFTDTLLHDHNTSIRDFLVRQVYM